MSIQFACPKGHRLTVSQDKAGALVRCPKCNCAVDVPVEQQSSVSDTSVLRLLGDYAAPRQFTPANQPSQRCPRCKSPLSSSARICRKCNLYFAPSGVY